MKAATFATVLLASIALSLPFPVRILQQEHTAPLSARALTGTIPPPGTLASSTTKLALSVSVTPTARTTKSASHAISGAHSHTGSHSHSASLTRSATHSHTASHLHSLVRSTASPSTPFSASKNTGTVATQDPVFVAPVVTGTSTLLVRDVKNQSKQARRDLDPESRKRCNSGIFGEGVRALNNKVSRTRLCNSLLEQTATQTLWVTVHSTLAPASTDPAYTDLIWGFDLDLEAPVRRRQVSTSDTGAEVVSSVTKTVATSLAVDPAAAPAATDFVVSSTFASSVANNPATETAASVDIGSTTSPTAGAASPASNVMMQALPPQPSSMVNFLSTSPATVTALSTTTQSPPTPKPFASCLNEAMYSKLCTRYGFTPSIATTVIQTVTVIEYH